MSFTIEGHDAVEVRQLIAMASDRIGEYVATLDDPLDDDGSIRLALALRDLSESVR